MHTISTESKVAFLTSIEALSGRHDVVDHEQFHRDFESLPVDDFTLAEWKQVVDFSTDQVSRWQVEWLFSPASSPNVHASAELEAWRQLWMVFSKSLVDQIPEVGEPLRRQHDLTAAQYLLERKLRHDAADSWARITSPVLSRIAIILNGIGLQSVGRKLYCLALYPPGSVGRSEP